METHHPATPNDLMRPWNALHTALDKLDNTVTTSPTPHDNTPMKETALDNADHADWWPPSQQTLMAIFTPPLCIPDEWDAFYNEHIKFLQDFQRSKIIPANYYANNGDE